MTKTQIALLENRLNNTAEAYEKVKAVNVKLQEENRRLGMMPKGNPSDTPLFDKFVKLTEGKNQAVRLPVATRYDILDPQFWYYMALLAGVGAKKYGDFNWHKSRLTGEKSPVNHAFQHLIDYQEGNTYDHKELGDHKRFHLIACAFNCMMEWFYESGNF